MTTIGNHGHCTSHLRGHRTTPTDGCAHSHTVCIEHSHISRSVGQSWRRTYVTSYVSTVHRWLKKTICLPVHVGKVLLRVPLAIVNVCTLRAVLHSVYGNMDRMHETEKYSLSHPLYVRIKDTGVTGRGGCKSN